MSSNWKQDWWKLSLIGLGTGALGGLVGGGADALIVPLLTVTKIFTDYKLSIGTSLAMLLPPIGIFAVFEYWKTKCSHKNVSCINWGYAMFLALMFTIGSWIIAHYAVDLESHILRSIYAIFLMGLGLIILLDEWLSRKRKIF